ncbi:MAG: hypothetical protein LBN06_11210 [Prevotellaceae bacterium]|jgi:hypothetical protein|nr:hypothetical protein [Prevotellaceae bacterium]
MKRLYIIAGIALTLPVIAGAQSQSKDSTLNRTVVVEQEYNPTISDAIKVNAVPQVAQPVAGRQEVRYDATAQPFANVPANRMPIYTLPEEQKRIRLGYVRLGYGNEGNLDMAAALNWLSPDTDDRLTANFLLNGMNGNLKLNDSNLEQAFGRNSWGAYRYHTHVDADYTHFFPQMELVAGANYDLRNFNYLSYPQAAHNRFMSNNFHLGVRSSTENPAVGYHARISFAYYERSPSPEGLIEQVYYDNLHEYNWHFNGGISTRISQTQRAGIDVDAHLINTSLDNGQIVDANPYYQFKNRVWNVRAGVHIGYTTGTGNTFSFAPDVLIEYGVSKGYRVYLQAKGGRTLNDFRRLEQLSPYSNIPVNEEYRMPGYSYEQVNAAIGFKGTPTDGLWFNLYAGTQQWYQDMLLQQELTPIFNYDISSQPTTPSGYVSQTLFKQANTRNLYVGGELRYTFKELFTLTANAVYRHWKLTGKSDTTEERSYLLSYKPLLEMDLRAEVRPIPALRLYAGYRYVSRNNTVSQIDGYDHLSWGTDYNPTENLYVGGDYRVTDAWSVYARFDNLLNKHYFDYPGYPAQAFNLLGGVRFCF